MLWDERLAIIKGDKSRWTRTGRGLLFELKTFPGIAGRISLALVLGPGESKMRTRVYEAARANPNLFAGATKPMGKQWVAIFSRDLQTLDQAKSQTFEAQEFCVRAAWSDFQGGQLQQLINEVLAIDHQLALP